MFSSFVSISLNHLYPFCNSSFCFQVCAVRAIQALAENNGATQRAVLEEGAAAPLLQLLKKSRGAATLVATATTLWALAGKCNFDAGISECKHGHGAWSDC